MYVVTLRSQPVGESVAVKVNGNQTEVVLGPEDHVNHDQKYIFSVTVINTIGNVTSHTSNVVGKYYSGLGFS